MRSEDLPASQYDIEDWRDIRGPYFDAVVAGVGRFGGHTLESLDDRLMAAFGYPRAQENDAERAVRAALGDSARDGRPEPPAAITQCA